MNCAWVFTGHHHHWLLNRLLEHRKFQAARHVLSLADSSGNTVLHYAAGGAAWFRGISADASAPKQGSLMGRGERPQEVRREGVAAAPQSKLAGRFPFYKAP